MKPGYAQQIEPGDTAYPRRLDALEPPRPTIHVLGRICDSPVAVAVVGARAASRSALDAAATLAGHVARRGGLVVSGGAVGVDSAAHRGALDAGGATVVVLGSGLDVPYPLRNRGLFARVVERGGALVSMFPAGAPPRRWHFVARNRLVAALADLIVVVEAGARSGSLSTARHAARMGRRLAAVPGTPGTRALLDAGAALVETPADLDRALAGSPRRAVRAPRSLDQERVWAALDPVVPRDPAEVADATGQSLGAAVALLVDLEAAGWTVMVPGGAYVRAPEGP